MDYFIVESDFKYAQLTDKIYKCMFKENAKEYRQVLSLNGLDVLVSRFIIEMENIVVSVANNLIDKDLLQEIITEIRNEIDYSEH